MKKGLTKWSHNREKKNCKQYDGWVSSSSTVKEVSSKKEVQESMCRGELL